VIDLIYLSVLLSDELETLRSELLDAGLLLGLLLLFFGCFLFYPVSLLLRGAFIVQGKLSLSYFEMLLSSPLQRQSPRTVSSSLLSLQFWRHC